MKRISTIFISSILLSLFVTCTCGRKAKAVEEEIIAENVCRQFVNLYIENSGSMAGYFFGDSKIKDVIKEYYDRISETNSANDTIKLNYINTAIETFHGGIKDYLVSTQKKCIAKYTKVDDILSMAMRECNDSTVNIVISDFCFTSNDGSIQMASSDITRIFTEQRKLDNNLCVAIFKYMSDFKGKYYPGGIPCNKPLPFYIWIFGNSIQVKKIVNLPIKSEDCGYMFLQPNQIVIPKVETKKARMVDGNSIIVKEWEKDKKYRDSDVYILNLKVNLKKLLLSEDDITNLNSYNVTKGYEISAIERIDEDNYNFEIRTNRPSPGELNIIYVLDDMPAWVKKSDFSGKGIPSDSTTLGIKDLIEGVYDSYHNSSDRYFTISITLK